MHRQSPGKSKSGEKLINISKLQTSTLSQNRQRLIYTSIGTLAFFFLQWLTTFWHYRYPGVCAAVSLVNLCTCLFIISNVNANIHALPVGVMLLF